MQDGRRESASPTPFGLRVVAIRGQQTGKAMGALQCRAGHPTIGSSHWSRLRVKIDGLLAHRSAGLLRDRASDRSDSDRTGRSVAKVARTNEQIALDGVPGEL